jgi:hypothetical protein
MNATVERLLNELRLGDAQTHDGLAVYPLLWGEPGPEYLTLSKALQQNLLTVTEVSEGGSVPELAVINTGELPVLLLDGEELAGAKQNRVLNTTVLISAASKTVINVSCTEQGRWSYASPEFADSGVIMARNIRAKKTRAVSKNLMRFQKARSDQGEIWQDIEDLSAAEGVHSNTGAMREVFEHRRAEHENALDAFPRVDQQCGLVFLVHGTVVGMDFVSRPEAYADLHGKLLRSYLIDARPCTGKTAAPATVETVHAFLDQARETTESSFPSVGLGTDCRYQRAELCGSALVHEETCIHAAFFRTIAEEDSGRMQGFRQRRRYRM